MIELLKEAGLGRAGRRRPTSTSPTRAAPTAAQAFVVAERLRDAGLDAVYHAGEGSLKSQMKKADASGAEFAVIVGEAELAQDCAALKALRGAAGATGSGEQRIVPLGRLADELVDALTRTEQQ